VDPGTTEPRACASEHASLQVPRSPQHERDRAGLWLLSANEHYRAGGRDTGGVSSRNVQLVREAFDAVNRGDAEWLIEHSAADVEIRGRGVAGEPVRYTGAAGIREYFHDMAESWQSMELVPEEIREVGDRVLAIANRRLRGRGSGIDVEDKVGVVYELRDGFAIRISGYRDVAEALAYLGSDA
jgi:ketosteroid isomerase-like protein